MLKQLTLNVSLPNSATFENFYDGNNQELLYNLQSLNNDTKNTFFYLWGKPVSGRTHLTLAACQYLNNLGRPTAYLSFKDRKLTPEVLENVDDLALLCLDDLDEILGHKEWEEAIFHAFNHLQTAAGNLIITATAPPLALQFGLRDLQSRLSSGLTLKIQALTDIEKVAALKLRAKYQGINLPADTASFLLNHYQRDLKSLFNILEKLAKAALIEKRALSIPFVKTVLI